MCVNAVPEVAAILIKVQQSVFVYKRVCVHLYVCIKCVYNHGSCCIVPVLRLCHSHGNAEAALSLLLLLFSPAGCIIITDAEAPARDPGEKSIATVVLKLVAQQTQLRF